MSIQIDVINKSTVLTNAQVDAMCAAVQYQARNHFAPAYGTDSAVVIARTTVQTAGHWAVFVLDNSDVQGALGYHEITSTDVPVGKIFAKTDQQYGLSPSVTFSHEVLEMLGDPFAAQTFQSGNSTFGAWEVCDPVEADALGYKINGVLVSDFVLPAWFVGGPGPYSFRRSVTRPLALAKGGYVALWTPSGGWTQQVARTEGVTSRSETMGRFKERLAKSTPVHGLPVSEPALDGDLVADYALDE